MRAYPSYLQVPTGCNHPDNFLFPLNPSHRDGKTACDELDMSFLLKPQAGGLDDIAR